MVDALCETDETLDQSNSLCWMIKKPVLEGTFPRNNTDFIYKTDQLPRNITILIVNVPPYANVDVC